MGFSTTVVHARRTLCDVGYIIGICFAAFLAATSAHAGDTSYKYDSLGRVKEVTYPDGKKISYTYDKAGNIIKATPYDPANPNPNYAPVCSNWLINMYNVPASVGPVSGSVAATAFTGNCTDANSDTLTVTSPAMPLNFTISAHQTLTFPFVVSDGNGGTGNATLTMTRP